LKVEEKRQNVTRRQEMPIQINGTPQVEKQGEMVDTSFHDVSRNELSAVARDVRLHGPRHLGVRGWEENDEGF